MWLKPLFALTLKNVKSGFRKWLEDLPRRVAENLGCKFSVERKEKSLRASRQPKRFIPTAEVPCARKMEKMYYRQQESCKAMVAFRASGNTDHRSSSRRVDSV
jgi:hypothetical protein